MPNWIDASIAAFFAGAIFLEMKRGFGRAIFDLAAFLLALRVTWMLHEPLSRSMLLAGNPHANQAVIYALGFVILGAALIFIGRLVHSATLVSTDVFDPILGVLCGLGVATIAAHVLVQAVALGAGDSSASTAVVGSMLGTEFLRFDTYHQVLETLYNFHREPVG